MCAVIYLVYFKRKYNISIIMKKYLLLFILLLSCRMTVMAQMSDSQVIEYVKEESAKGKDQKEIAKNLISRGVSVKQLERLRDKYQSQNSRVDMLSDGDNIRRTRINNGEVREQNADDKLLQYAEIYEEADSVKVFGRDIFRYGNLSFEPNMNIATPSHYTLGPGDEVIVDIYGASQFNGSFVVAPDGSITIPNEGPVSVAGLTVSQAQARVSRAIGGHYQDSTIKLSVGQTRTVMVNVLGEVKVPGTYTLSAFATVFNALYLAGGISDIGTLRNIKVSRNGRIVTTVDIYDFILNGKLGGNIMLQDNDAIIVGTYRNLVKAEGKVKRPMYYEMKDGESLQSLLKYAGGMTGDAYKQNVRIERIGDEGMTIYNVDEWDYSSFKTQDGDVAVIQAVIERYKNTVEVKGAVFREGQYRLNGTVNSIRTLITQAGGLTEDAFATRGVLHRMKADRTRMALTINLAGIMNGASPDVMLQNEDSLIIASVEELNKQRTLSIYGEVFKPGIYKYSEGETIEDLITEAGGLLESASLVNVEVAQRILSSTDNPTGKNTAKVHSFTLRNGLAIEGETGFKLQPYDIVTIHKSPDYQVQQAINVSGEVKYSGTYILSSKEERLTDILKRAGGMTDNAYVNGVQVIRKVSKEELDIQRRKLEVAMNATDSLEVMKTLQQKSYNVGVDLQKALRNPGSASDIVMQEGDSIYVPQLNNVVKISGEVLFPNTVAYEEGRSASYYINQAGGVNKTGKKSLAYIVYPNGQASKIRKGDILPGCEIVVPTKPEKKVDTQRTSMWLALASSVSTIAAVLITALK